MAAEAAERRKRTIVRGVIIAALVIGVIVLYSVFAGGDDDGDGTTTAASTTVATTAAPTTAAPESDSELAVAPADIGCPAEDGSSETFRQFAEAPPMCIDEDADYVASFQTSVGDFDVFIDPTLDPISANNFVFLARYGAYDGTIFHRIIENFVVQGGDVELADGIGNPGYRFTGGVPEAGQYREGSIAMANSGDSSSNGSQFFIVTGPNGAALPPLYSLFGQVIDGLDVPLEMQLVETGAADKPIEDVVVDSVTIREATADDVAAYEAAVG